MTSTPHDRAAPGKKLVLCCDGTANEFATDRTNVLKLCYALEHSPAQKVYYHPGLGTMEPPGALTPLARRTTRLLGQAVGAGLEDDVRDAYVFLMRHFEPGDRVFLFGFSRGAYTVRALASLLHMYGLLASGNESLVPYAIRMMMAIQKLDARGGGPDDKKPYFRLAEDFRATFGRTECKPHFVGVWDTVSSVGWIENQLRLPFVANNPSIQIGRHAIAIDERRAFFRTNLWRPRSDAESGPKDLKQVWFAGVHCDVGGGYPEAESSASKIPLEWMIREATMHDLRMDAERVDIVLGKIAGGGYVAPDVNGPLHESLSLAWKPAELILKRHYNAQTQSWERRANLGRRRTIPPRSLVHESVFKRRDDYKSRLPSDAICEP